MMKNVVRLQCAQNAIARIVVWGTNRQLTSLSVLLKHYHWLPILQRIQFKIACITYKTILTTQPAYLNSVLEHYNLSRTLRSSDNILFSVPRVHTCFDCASELPQDYKSGTLLLDYRATLYEATNPDDIFGAKC